MDETLTSPRKSAGTARATLPNFPFLVARAQKEENANSPPYIPTLHPTSLVSCTQTVADFITGVSPLRGAWRGGFGTRPAADSCPAAVGSARAEARQRLRGRRSGCSSRQWPAFAPGTGLLCPPTPPPGAGVVGEALSGPRPSGSTRRPVVARPPRPVLTCARRA